MKMGILSLVLASQVFSMSFSMAAKADTTLVPEVTSAIGDGTYHNSVITLHSNEYQTDVVDDLFSLLGRSGRVINGDHIRLYPLELEQGFAKSAGPTSPGFNQTVTLSTNAEDIEFDDDHQHLFIEGDTAFFLFDLMKNNFFNRKIAVSNEGAFEKFQFGRLTCQELISKVYRIQCDLYLNGITNLH